MSAKFNADTKSIRFRLWISFAIVGMSILAIIWLLQTVFLNYSYEKMKTEEVASVASSISDAFKNNDSNLMERIQKLTISNDFYIVMESKAGLLLFSPDRDNRMPVYMYREHTGKLKKMLEDSNGNPVSFSINSGLDNYNTLAYGIRVSSFDGSIANLYIFSPLYPVSSTVSILKRQLLSVSIITIIACFILAMYFANRVSKPIKKIEKTAKVMGRGEYDIKFEGDSYSEINSLADTLNNTAYELSEIDNRRKDLIANVSHDLKTPLTLIRSYAEMIRDLSGDDPEKRNEHLGVIIEETDRLTQIVNDVATINALNMHKVALEKTTYDLVESLTLVLNTYKVMENEGFVFNLKTPKTAFVVADESKIKQVISNLVSNAVKYCGKDKTVTITIKKTSNKYRLEVSDHGPGIPQEEIPHVWERYYRASSNFNRPQEGSGLGLSIVKGILTKHHAGFGVESKVGHGSTFWFELPASKQSPNKNAVKSPDQSSK